jgi:prepilin-type N-terminal cleavage/methylation domain-containing protein
MRTSFSQRGFTLIEILVVVSIIAILASMILGAVTLARKSTYVALAKSTVSNLSSQLGRYVQDTGKYPGSEYKDEENAFPALFEALFGEKPPKGKGGPSAPYGEFKEDDVAVLDDSGEDNDSYRKATPDEIYDPKIPKYLIDPWGKPYVYHENKSRARKEYMHGRNFDIYSRGPDKTDQTVDGEKENIDDIGVW